MAEDEENLPSEEEDKKGGGLKIKVPSESSETATSTSSEELFVGRGKRKKKAKKRKKKLTKLSPIAAAASNARSLKNDSKSNSPVSKGKGQKRKMVSKEPKPESLKRQERRIAATSEAKEKVKNSNKEQHQKKRASLKKEEKEELQELDTAARQRDRESMGEEEKEGLQELDTASRQSARKSMGKEKVTIVKKADTSNRATARNRLSKSQKKAIREANTLAHQQQREDLKKDKESNKKESSPSIIPENFADFDQDPNNAQWLFNSRGPLGAFNDLYDVAVPRAMDKPATQEQIDAAVTSTIPLIDEITDQIHLGKNDRIEFANAHGSFQRNGLPVRSCACACCGINAFEKKDKKYKKCLLTNYPILQYSNEIPRDVAKYARVQKASQSRDRVSNIPFSQILSFFELVDENNVAGSLGSLWHLHREFVDYDVLMGAYWYWACADCYSALETKPRAERPKFGIANVDFGGFFRINIYDISAVEFMAISLHITFMLLIKMSAPGKSTSGSVVPVIQGQTVTFSTSASLDTAEKVSAALAAEADAGNRFPNRTLHEHLQLTWIGTTGQLKKHLSSVVPYGKDTTARVDVIFRMLEACIALDCPNVEGFILTEEIKAAITLYFEGSPTPPQSSQPASPKEDIQAKEDDEEDQSYIYNYFRGYIKNHSLSLFSIFLRRYC